MNNYSIQNCFHCPLLIGLNVRFLVIVRGKEYYQYGLYSLKTKSLFVSLTTSVVCLCLNN